MNAVNYLRVDWDSCHFGSIDQIITSAKYLIPDCSEKERFVKQLEKSKRMGYELIKQMMPTVSPDISKIL